MSASLPLLFRNSRRYRRTLASTARGVAVTETSGDPRITAAIRAHAAEVTWPGVDVSDSRTAAVAFERRYGIGYPSLDDPSASIELAFGRVIPDTLLLNRAGGIQARVIGQVTYPGLERLLGHVLNDPG